MKEAVTLLLLDSYDGVEWRDPKVLAVKRLKSKGKLGLPGGKVDTGETLEEAIIREVKEECNVTIPKEALVKVYACIVNGYYCTTFAVTKEHLKTMKYDELKQVEIEIEPTWVKFNTYDFVMKSEFIEYNAGLLRNMLEIIEYLKMEEETLWQ
mgnify:CR=1 FL=1